MFGNPTLVFCKWFDGRNFLALLAFVRARVDDADFTLLLHVLETKSSKRNTCSSRSNSDDIKICTDRMYPKLVLGVVGPAFLSMFNINSVSCIH